VFQLTLLTLVSLNSTVTSDVEFQKRFNKQTHYMCKLFTNSLYTKVNYNKHIIQNIIWTDWPPNFENNGRDGKRRV